MAGAAARALQYEYKAVGVNFMYEKLKAVVNTNAGTAKFCLQTQRFEFYNNKGRYQALILCNYLTFSTFNIVIYHFRTLILYCKQIVRSLKKELAMNPREKSPPLLERLREPEWVRKPWDPNLLRWKSEKSSKFSHSCDFLVLEFRNLKFLSKRLITILYA